MAAAQGACGTPFARSFTSELFESRKIRLAGDDFERIADRPHYVNLLVADSEFLYPFKGIISLFKQIFPVCRDRSCALRARRKWERVRGGGVPRLLQGGSRPPAGGARLGCAQLAHRPDRRDDLCRVRAARNASGRARCVMKRDPKLVVAHDYYAR